MNYTNNKHYFTFLRVELIFLNFGICLPLVWLSWVICFFSQIIVLLKNANKNYVFYSHAIFSHLAQQLQPIGSNPYDPAKFVINPKFPSDRRALALPAARMFLIIYIYKYIIYILKTGASGKASAVLFPPSLLYNDYIII